jgi:hypothetical protein
MQLCSREPELDVRLNLVFKMEPGVEPYLLLKKHIVLKKLLHPVS